MAINNVLESRKDVVVYSSGSFKDFDEPKYFEGLPHFEKYDEKKKYNENQFEHDYGNGMKSYFFQLYDLSFCRFPDEHRVYMLVKEVKSKSQNDSDDEQNIQSEKTDP
jgi:hypothetical protein